MKTLYRTMLVCAASLTLMTGAVTASETAAQSKSLTLLVMDPLAAPLSCPCVEGYAQRKYEALASHLEKKTGYAIRLVFSEALETALKGEAKDGVDIIIGKASVVRADTREANLDALAIARLTGKDGTTTQTGLIVVAKDDAAKSVADLKGYQIIFGPAECDEKHQAALELLKAEGVPRPKKLLIDQACSDGACKVIEKGPAGRTAAVISSYAAPLLEGCGTIKKGDLRVIGETKPVPFVTAFTTHSVDPQLRSRLQVALVETATEPEVLMALESLIGFVPVEATKELASKKK